MRPFASIYTHHTAYCLLVLLLTANFCQRHCTVRGNRFGLKEHHYVSSNRDAATRDPDIAWIVQTGQSTAREAVVAKLLTTLQNEHNIGLVADVQSDDTIPLVDTGHRVQNWSQEHWAAEVARNGQQAVEHRTGALSQTHPQYYQHWAFKVLAGFDAAYKRWPDADWYIMIEDDTFIFQASMRDFLLQFDPQQKHYLGYPTRGVSQCREPTKPSQQESTGQTFNLTQMHNQQQLANVSTTSTSQPQSIRRLLHRLAFRERRHPDTQVLNDAEAFRHGSDRTPSAHVERQQDIKKTFTSQATSEYSLLNQEIATADHAQQQLQSGKSLHAQASTQQTSEEMYALSGGGMILSRGAMASLAPLLKGCMLSSQDCHLDDVRLYLCLKQAGIRLNTSSGYVALNLAPNRNIDWGRFDPCTRPAVIHEVAPMAMHMLWEAEQQHSQRPTMADLFAHISLWGEHSERPGLQYNTRHMFRNVSHVVSRRACREACEQHPGCKAWNYNISGQYCELLDSLSKPDEQWQHDSGISQPAYVCSQDLRIAQQ